MDAQKADLSALRIDRQKDSEETGKSRRVTWIVSACVIVAVVLVGYFALGNALAQAVEVTLATATMSSPSQSSAVLTASGYVVAQRKASVASKATGRLVYLGVVEGDKVKKDQIIARLEDSDMQAALDQAKANLKVNEADLVSAQRALDREKALFAKGLSTQADYDNADANYRKVLANIDVAKAEVTAQQVALENTRVRAPFDGTVLTKNADVGEMVVPMAASAGSKSAVVTIADMSSLQVEADVSESNIERVTPNQPCEITLDAYPDKRYAGYVAKIVPTADRAKATVLVKVAFKNYDSTVLPEMSAKVLFLSKPVSATALDSRSMLTVPATSVVARHGRSVVFKVTDDKATEVAVTTGKQLGSLVEITSGLSAGDKVVEDVNETIVDGLKVKVR
ncbi:MAG TPA: efflux RND transporter periplasmic adaptor subunit [Terriglobia bacterium]|nr:efflux RND transporter periplasmic adaptor subunit [Terriglobia bacterium]